MSVIYIYLNIRSSNIHCQFKQDKINHEILYIKKWSHDLSSFFFQCVQHGWYILYFSIQCKVFDPEDVGSLPKIMNYLLKRKSNFISAEGFISRPEILRMASAQQDFPEVFVFLWLTCCHLLIQMCKVQKKTTGDLFFFKL